jgi:serine/threonine-protein kinase
MIAHRMKVCPACALVYPDETTFCFLTGDTLQPAGDAIVGTSVGGRFRVVSKLSEGPWATQYNATFRLIAQPCTMKILKEPLSPENQEAFSSSLALARRCTHANVSEVLGGGILPDGRGFVVHEHIEAAPLSELLMRGNMPPAQALSIATQMLRALGRVHDFGAVHGSLTPTNVLVSPQGHVQLVEVGLGRGLTNDPFADDPRALFAQRYIAPELSSQQRSSANADIYAVGAIVVHMLTGQTPLEAATVAELRTKVNEHGIDVQGRLGALHEKLRDWLQLLVDRNPEGRHANAHLAADALAEACEEAGVKMLADPGRAPSPASQQLASGFARWERFRSVFSKMVATGFPNGAPAQVKDPMAQIAGRVEDLGALGKKALFEHGNLDDVAKRAREGRGRIASQMDEINAGAKEVRQAVQPLKVAAARHGEKAKAFPIEAREAHREVMMWEGRSALVEPYKELADAYAKMADIIERWWAVRSAQLTCERDAADKNEELRASDEQLEELRKALRVHESNLADERKSTEETLAKLGHDADRLEMELLDLASRFSAPLRSKPELGAQFRELASMA